MATRTKTFDCVKMKHDAQKRLRSEYEARKGEFSSYSEFLAATIDEDPWQQDVWGRASAPSEQSE